MIGRNNNLNITGSFSGDKSFERSDGANVNEGSLLNASSVSIITDEQNT